MNGTSEIERTKTQLLQLLEQLKSGSGQPGNRQLVEELSKLSLYNQLSVTEWLSNLIKRQYVEQKTQRNETTVSISVDQLLFIIQIMESAQDFFTLMNTLLWILDKTTQPSIMYLVVSTIRKHEVLVLCYNSLLNLVQALINKVTEKNSIDIKSA